ncbi:toxic anion resistance protein [Xanthomonas campestris pv. campestris]|nr:toxic anion resistance protein [Xanthomonas campestris pv. campestris]
MAIGTSEAMLAALDYKALGLRSETDTDEIRQLANRIHSGDSSSVAEFGRDVAELTASYSDGLLDQVRNTDLDGAGAKLTEVVQIARGLNVGPLSDKRSRLPLIGPVIDRLRARGENFMGRFDSTRDQIDALLTEVQTTQDNVRERNVGLTQMFDAVKVEHRLLGIHIAAGTIRLAELRQHAEGMRKSVGNDPAALQELSDLDALIAALDKRVGDLHAMQHSAMQALPMIRMIQANNQMLVDKFHTIKELTVPAWKRSFTLALTLNEQSNAVRLANTIDDTTNDLLKRNAQLLHRNSVETAKANQRLVIDPETLKAVNAELIKTVEDVIRLNAEGSQARARAVKDIEALRHDMRQRIVRAPAAQVAITQERV